MNDDYTAKLAFVLSVMILMVGAVFFAKMKIADRAESEQQLVSTSALAQTANDNAILAFNHAQSAREAAYSAEVHASEAKGMAYDAQKNALAVIQATQGQCYALLPTGDRFTLSCEVFG